MARHTTHFEDPGDGNLAVALGARVKGRFAGEAVVELLISLCRWLARRDFAAVAIAGGRDGVTGRAVVWIYWEAAMAALSAGGLPCATSEAKVLAIAASIAAGLPVTLGQMMSGLDECAAVAVAGAVLHVAGRRDLLIRRSAR